MLDPQQQVVSATSYQYIVIFSSVRSILLQAERAALMTDGCLPMVVLALREIQKNTNISVVHMKKPSLTETPTPRDASTTRNDAPRTPRDPPRTPEAKQGLPKEF